jgi:hypothetical protein
MKDARDTLLFINAKVAFNYSGAIAVGRIVEMKDGIKNQWGSYDYKHRPSIKIARETHLKHSNNIISTVRDPANVLVIFEDN